MGAIFALMAQGRTYSGHVLLVGWAIDIACEADGVGGVCAWLYHYFIVKAWRAGIATLAAAVIAVWTIVYSRFYSRNSLDFEIERVT